MGQHHALRVAGRPAREQDLGERPGVTELTQSSTRRSDGAELGRRRRTRVSAFDPHDRRAERLRVRVADSVPASVSTGRTARPIRIATSGAIRRSSGTTDAAKPPDREVGGNEPRVVGGPGRRLGCPARRRARPASARDPSAAHTEFAIGPPFEAEPPRHHETRASGSRSTARSSSSINVSPVRSRIGSAWTGGPIRTSRPSLMPLSNPAARNR